MSVIINREGNFKDETISSIPLGINNIMLNNETNVDLKKDEINNIKPMLSNNSNTIFIPDGKRVKIKPILNKKVPSNTFSMMANTKKKFLNSDSDDATDATDATNSTDNSSQSGTNEILSNSITSNNSKQKNNYKDNNEEYSDDDEDPDDYSSINSNINKKSQNMRESKYEESEDEEEEDDESEDQPVKKKSYEEIQQEKQQLLFNLERLQKQGFPPSKRYTMASSYEDMQFEHDRLKKQRDVEKSIKFSRKILMALVSGVEFLNGRFDPFDIKLEGWSENIMENVSDYDEVFEELHDKYSDSVKMAPELKLIAMVAGSGFMFHLTNSLFKSASPKLSDILKQNPDIMKNISEAAAKNMGNTINQEFGQDDIIGNLMKGGIGMKMNQQRGPMGPSMGPSMGGNKNNQAKMNGPVGIDELLNELNNGNTKDDVSISSNESINIKSSAKRTKVGKKGIQLDIR
jgi:hypothetical protein